MKILIMFCVISLSAAMWLQSSAMNHATTTSTITDTARPPSEVAVSSDLFRLTSSSDFVAIGTVTSIKGVVARLSEQEYKEAADDLSKVDGGITLSKWRRSYVLEPTSSPA